MSQFWQQVLYWKDIANLSLSKFCYINPVCLGFESPTGLSPSSSSPAWQGRRVASSKLWMLEFSAFLEQQQDQDTVRYTPDFHPSINFWSSGSSCSLWICYTIIYVWKYLLHCSTGTESNLWEKQDILLLENRIAYSDTASSVPCASGLPFQDHGCLHTSRHWGCATQWYSPCPSILAALFSLGG